MRILKLALVLAIASPAFAEVDPDKGVFLVARPKIDGGPFAHSVVLILAHGDGGTLGVIVNRASDVPLEEALPDLQSKRKPGHSLHFGGPVGLDGLLFLFRSDEPHEGADQVMDHVYYSGGRNVLETLLDENMGPEELRVFLGHAGWAPGQLRAEIARGDWDLVRADAFTVFQKDPKTLWLELSPSSRTTADS
ncbi:MAG TPA: YqgE/AlgH family protein [Vicinamibacteria bacterium]|nr:YqgE/AlgH family protein [Vicinamibacteria bacterium]